MPRADYMSVACPNCGARPGEACFERYEGEDGEEERAFSMTPHDERIGEDALDLIFEPESAAAIRRQEREAPAGGPGPLDGRAAWLIAGVVAGMMVGVVLLAFVLAAIH